MATQLSRSRQLQLLDEYARTVEQSETSSADKADPKLPTPKPEAIVDNGTGAIGDHPKTDHYAVTNGYEEINDKDEEDEEPLDQVQNQPLMNVRCI